MWMLGGSNAATTTTTCEMLCNRDTQMGLFGTFTVDRTAALVAVEGDAAAAAVHGGSVLFAIPAGWSSPCLLCRQQLESDCIFKQFVGWFGRHLVAAWACERSLWACIVLQLHCTPTAGMVEAQVQLHRGRRNMEKEV
jgi:hypothetical protein